MEQAENVDASNYEHAFVEHALAWADANDVTATAFESEGVPKDVLARAGFAVKKRGRRRPTSTRISADQIRSAVSRKRGKFTVADITEQTGGSTATVRKVIDEIAGRRRAGRSRNRRVPHWSRKGTQGVPTQVGPRSAAHDSRRSNTPKPDRTPAVDCRGESRGISPHPSARVAAYETTATKGRPGRRHGECSRSHKVAADGVTARSARRPRARNYRE